MKRLLALILTSLLFLLTACGSAIPVEPSATTAPGQAATDAPTTAPNTPTTEAVPTTAQAATAPVEPTATPTAAPAVLCPDLPRPALILTTNSGFSAHDPLAGARCPLPLPETATALQVGGDNIYFVISDSEAGTSVVSRLGADGAITPLEATRATGDVFYQLRFAVATDGSTLAWSHMAPQADPSATTMLGSLWIGAADGSAPVAIFEEQVGGELRIVTPLRFSADGATLFYTWEPTGLGGSWMAFNGRYDNLYRVPVAGGAPQKVFDCADMGLFLCAGDFRDDGTVAYIDTERTIHVVGPDGAPLASVPTAGDYAGYPTFGPTGDLYYSEAVLPSSGIDPTPGSIYRLAAPYDGAPALVASADNLMPPLMAQPFLDAEHLVIGYFGEQRTGMALLSATGEIDLLEPPLNPYLATVWPAK